MSGMRRIDFTMAASGAVVGTLHVVDEEELIIDPYLLSTHNLWDLMHFVVLDGTTVTPLIGYRIVATGDAEVQLVDKPVELINAWFLCTTPGEFTGQRKWYKEFRHFAATSKLFIPQMSGIEQESDFLSRRNNSC